MSDLQPAGSYFLRRSASSQPIHRVFCFPPAGVGAASYFEWRQFLPPAFELIAIQLPGRENRLREPLCDDLSQVIADVVTGLEPLLGCPSTFFGHSFGALLAYECCITLQRVGLPLPTHLVVSGANPPNWPLSVNPEYISQLALKRLMARFGWKSTEDVDRTIASVALEVLSADLNMMQRHQFAEELLRMPLTVLGATDDPIVSLEALQQWTSLAHSHELLVTTGGHFFFEAHTAGIVKLILAHAAK